MSKSAEISSPRLIENLRCLRIHQKILHIPESRIGYLHFPVMEQVAVEAGSAESGSDNPRTEHPVRLSMRGFGVIH